MARDARKLNVALFEIDGMRSTVHRECHKRGVNTHTNASRSDWQSNEIHFLIKLIVLIP